MDTTYNLAKVIRLQQKRPPIDQQPKQNPSHLSRGGLYPKTFLNFCLTFGQLGYKRVQTSAKKTCLSAWAQSGAHKCDTGL